MFHGSITALVTPFRDGAFDENAFRAFVEWQIASGAHGLVPCGTTGEANTLSAAEHERVIIACAETARGRAPVIAGAGGANTAAVIELARTAKRAGADAAMVVAPYYNKPNQEGLEAHFRAVADAVDLPIVLYNIPGRSVVDVSIETLAKLAEHPNIVALKDATGDIARVSRQRAAFGAAFAQLSGEDASALGFNAHGGVGAISVTANVAPGLCARFQSLTLKAFGGPDIPGSEDVAREDAYAEALRLQGRLLSLHDAMFASPSPGPAKAGLAHLGKMSDAVRLPITPPPAAVRAQVVAALEALQPVDAT